MAVPFSNDSAPSSSVRFATLALLVALVWIAFGGVFGNGWIFLDDHEYVTRDPHVQAGLTWEGFTWFLHEFQAGNWHPLTSWSHMLDVGLFGTSPRGPHVENVVLHALNAALLAHVLFLYTKRWWPSACVAALFALHPLRVESVAWISERKDVLSGLFFVLTLWAWKIWIDRPGTLRFVLVAIAFALGLMSKPMLVTVPFLLLLLDTWPLARAGALGQRIVEKVPLFALTGASIVVTWVAQSTSGATAALGDTSVADRASTALTAYARYLGSTFAPRDLAPMYPYEHARGALFPLLSLLGLVAVTVLVWRSRARRPHLLLGWLWYCGMLIPVIGLLQVGSQSHADRYTYLPGIGIAIAIVFEVADVQRRRTAWRIPVWIACGAVLVALMSLTRAQTRLWRDTCTLFEHTLRVTRDNPTGQKIFGDALVEAGDHRGAIPYYEEALRLAPGLRDGRKNLGCALARTGRFDAAAEQFRLAAAADPTFENYFNLGWALGDAGKSADAVAPLARALELDDSSAPAHMRLGLMLENLQRVDEAMRHLRRAVELAPDDLEARRTLARSYRSRGDVEAALREYRATLSIDANDVETLVNLARLCATHQDQKFRDGAEAVRLAERARDVAQEPFSFLYGALAAAYAEAGRFDEAVQAASRAVELARQEGDPAAAARYESQLAEHRAGRPIRAQ